jgi:hypothetical protein
MGRMDPDAMRQRMVDRRFAKMDTDGNESISKDEFIQASKEIQAHMRATYRPGNVPSAEEIFQVADTDRAGDGAGDGYLSKDELSAMLDRAGPGMSKGGPPGLGKGEGEPPALGKDSPPGLGRGGPPAGMRGPGATAGIGGGSSSASTEDSSSETDDPADLNGDGEVTLAERLAYNLKKLEQFEQFRASQDDTTAQNHTDSIA